LAVKRGAHYNKPLREEAKRQIRRLLVDEGLSYHAIMEKLQLPQRTFHRYVSEIFDYDRRLIANTISDEEALNQMVLCEQRLLRQRQQILDGIANNTAADYKARVEAHHLAGEIAAVVMKLYGEAPSLLAQRHSFPVTPSLPLQQDGTSGIRLISKEQEPEEESYQRNVERISEQRRMERRFGKQARAATTTAPIHSQKEEEEQDEFEGAEEEEGEEQQE
jgi:hypothetical protein